VGVPVGTFQLVVAFLTRDSKASIAGTRPEVNQVLVAGDDTLAACRLEAELAALASALLRA
jgi:hypothetical protein